MIYVPPSGEVKAPTRSDATVAGGSAQCVCVLVLGMHRSGTSALARALSLMGATLPANVIGRSLGNDAGHWEPERLVAINDEILAELGSSWDDWRPLDMPALAVDRREHYKSQIRTIIEEEYGSTKLFVLKDPRLCRFGLLYDEILTGLGVRTIYAIIYRNPLSVARSLAARNGYSPEYSTLLWLRHMLDSEQATRHRERSFVSYERLMEKWRDGVSDIARQLGIGPQQWEAPVGAFIDSQLSPYLSHHVHTRSDLTRVDVLDAWVERTYDSFAALCEDPSDAAAVFTLDDVRRSFDPLAGPFGTAMYQEFARMKAELDRLRAVEARLATAAPETAGVPGTDK